MALFAKQIPLFLLLTLLSTLHARDSQFFNKIPSTTTTSTTPVATTTTSTPTATLPNTEHLPNNEQVQNQQEQEPEFNPENENSYGLYSHETGQLTPSTTTNTNTQVPLNKHLPKNYNPVAYVTVAEDNNDNSEFTDEKTFANKPYTNQNSEFTDEKTFASKPFNSHNSEFTHEKTFANNAPNRNYYNNFQEQQQEEEPESQNYANNNNNDNYNYEKFNYMSGGSSFNSQPQARTNGFQPQGMSDTRFMENGKYFYDVNNEKYNNNHPYESLKRVQPTNEFSNNRNFYGNNGNGNEFSSNKNFYGNGNEFNNRNFNGNRGNDNEFDNGYQSQAEFQNEENYNMP